MPSDIDRSDNWFEMGGELRGQDPAWNSAQKHKGVGGWPESFESEIWIDSGYIGAFEKNEWKDG